MPIALLNVFFRSVAEISAKAVPLLFMLLILRYLGIESYGVQTQIDNLRAMCAPIAALGLGIGLVRVTSGNSNKEINSRYLVCSIFPVLVMSLTIFLLIEVFAPWLNQTLFRVQGVEALIRLSALLVPLTALESLINDFCRGRLLIVDYSISQIMAAIVASGGAYIAIQSGGGLLNIVQIMLAAKALSVIFLVSRLAWIGEFSAPPGFLQEFRLADWIVGGLPVMITSFLSWGVSLGDRFIIGGLRNAAEVGQYATAYNAMLILVSVAAPFWGPMYPLMASRLNRGDETGSAALCRRYTAAYALVAFPCLAGLVIVGPQLLAYLTNRNATVSWVILLVLGLGLLADQLAASFHYYFYARGEPGKVVKILGIACLANWLGNLILVQWFGIMGAAVMTLATFILMAALLMQMARGMGCRIKHFYNVSSLSIYFASTIAMAASLLIFGDLHNTQPGIIALNIGIGIAAYCFFLCVFFKGRVDVLIQKLKS